MEIFGSTFDDSVFSETKDKVCVGLLPYKAKCCESQWFCESEALDTEDSLDKQKVFKFRGDLASKQRNYKEALEAYSSCLERVPDNNLTIRRDVLEGMARCYSGLGQDQRALDLADLLSKDASNTCHLTSLLLLKVSIHQRSGALGPKMASLEQLCSLLPFNPWHWYNLGQTCLQQLEATRSPRPHGDEDVACKRSLQSGGAGAESDGGGTEEGRGGETRDEEGGETRDQEGGETRDEEGGETRDQEGGETRDQEGGETRDQEGGETTDQEGGETTDQEGGERVWLEACMSLIRTRLLLHMLRQQQSSFVLQRSDSALLRSEEALQRLNPPETTLQTLTTVMSEDLVPEKMREDQDGESLASVSLQSFSERWWNKVLRSRCTRGDPYTSD